MIAKLRAMLPMDVRNVQLLFWGSTNDPKTSHAGVPELRDWNGYPRFFVKSLCERSKAWFLPGSEALKPYLAPKGFCAECRAIAQVMRTQGMLSMRIHPREFYEWPEDKRKRVEAAL